MILTLLALIITRYYWTVDPIQFATSGSFHTHVSVTGYVAYTRTEYDGDFHIRILPTQDVTTPYFIAECIPSQPCAHPSIGAHVQVKGIVRRDPEHGWWEIHPVEQIILL
jgi:hypothetical protein